MYMDDSGQTILSTDTNSDTGAWMEALNPYGSVSNLILCPATHIRIAEPQGIGTGGGTASLAWYYWGLNFTAPINGSYSINGWLLSYDETNYTTYSGAPPTPVTSNPQFVFNKPTSVQRPTQTPLFSDAVWLNEWPLEGDAPAADLSSGAYNSILGMPRCTIWRHGGKTATSPTPVGYSMLPPLYRFPNGSAINIGFADGHAQMVKLQDLWTLYWHYNWKTPP